VKLPTSFKLFFSSVGAGIVAAVLILASIVPAQQTRESPSIPIVPKQMQAEFLRIDSENIWTDYIYSSNATKLYVLSFEPQVDVSKRIIGIDLVLRDVKNPKKDENLLNPTGIWHGLQPYSFMAQDLLHGPSESAFGRERSIAVRSRGLHFTVELLDVKVSGGSDGAHQIDSLKLSIAADNSPHAIGR
jgi:hypothetical protein